MLLYKPARSPEPPATEPTLTSPAGRSIAATERACGVAKETLRIWERRYGFPQPVRDAAGDRLYPDDQVQRLQQVRRAMSLGHRPGRLLMLDADSLHRLAGAPAEPQPSECAASGFGVTWLPLLRQHDPAALRRAMQREIGSVGLKRFVVDVLAPALRGLGEAWHHGQVQIFEEHLFTQSAMAVLGAALAAAPASRDESARVLLTTLPGEQHGLALLMSEALLSLEGARCHSIGLQTPVAQIVEAARALRSHIVVLGCSPCVETGLIRADLDELRASLPETAALWLGGSSPALRRRRAGVKRLRSLDDLAPALAQWRRGLPQRGSGTA